MNFYKIKQTENKPYYFPHFINASSYDTYEKFVDDNDLTMVHIGDFLSARAKSVDAIFEGGLNRGLNYPLKISTDSSIIDHCYAFKRYSEIILTSQPYGSLESVKNALINSEFIKLFTPDYKFVISEKSSWHYPGESVLLAICKNSVKLKMKDAITLEIKGYEPVIKETTHND